MRVLSSCAAALKKSCNIPPMKLRMLPSKQNLTSCTNDMDSICRVSPWILTSQRNFQSCENYRWYDLFQQINFATMRQLSLRLLVHCSKVCVLQTCNLPQGVHSVDWKLWDVPVKINKIRLIKKNQNIIISLRNCIHKYFFVW